MPQAVITQNTAAQNGATGTVINGLNDVRIVSFDPNANQWAFGSAGFNRSGAGVAESHQIYYPSGIMEIPARATIASAFLQIRTPAPGASSGAITVQAQQLAARPEVTRATWNDRGLEKPWTTAGGDVTGPVLDTVIVNADSTWFSFDVTLWAQSVNDGNYNTGLGLFTQDGDPFGLRFIGDYKATDGERPQLVINYTDGFVDANLPRQQAPITFTGNDGDPTPAPLVDLLSSHQIVNNQLEGVGVQQTDPNGYSAFLAGAETNSADGELTVTYDPKGGGGSLSGAMIRYVENGKFIDFIMVGSDQLSGFVLHPNAPTGESLGTFSLPAGTFAAGTFDLTIRFRGDYISVWHLGVQVFSVVTSTYNDATIHGFKYIAAGAAACDNLALPQVPPVAPVVDAGQVFNIPENSVATFGPVATTREPESVPTGFTIEGAEFTINSSGIITPATPKDFANGTSYTLGVTVTDQFGQSATENITINITDVDESVTPTVNAIDTNFSELAAQNIPGGVVAPIVATDADEYALSGPDAALFNIVGTNITLVAALDPGTYSATITVTNNDPDPASAFEQTANASFDLLVISQFVPSVDPGQTLVVTKNTVVPYGPVATTRQDDSVVTSFTVTGDDFTINTSGQLTPAVGFDLTTTRSIVVAVTVTDQYGTSQPINVTVNVVSVASVLFGEFYLLPKSKNDRTEVIKRLRNNSMDMLLHNLKDVTTDLPVNDATVEVLFTETTEEPIPGLESPIPLTSIDSNGNYSGSLDYTILNDRSNYLCFVTATVAGTAPSVLELENRVLVIPRINIDETLIDTLEDIITV